MRAACKEFSWHFQPSMDSAFHLKVDLGFPRGPLAWWVENCGQEWCTPGLGAFRTIEKHRSMNVSLLESPKMCFFFATHMRRKSCKKRQRWNSVFSSPPFEWAKLSVMWVSRRWERRLKSMTWNSSSLLLYPNSVSFHLLPNLFLYPFPTERRHLSVMNSFTCCCLLGYSPIGQETGIYYAGSDAVMLEVTFFPLIWETCWFFH